MNFNEELGKVLSDRDVEKIVEFPLIFKSKLGLNDKAYEFLSNAKTLEKFLTMILSGLGGGFGGLIAWFLTLGIWGQILFLVSLVNPYTWIMIGAGLGVGSFYCLKKIIDIADDNFMTKVPKNITSPIDLLGLSVVDVLCIPAVKIAMCDGDYADCEKEMITNYFTKEWGINKVYIEKYQKVVSLNITNMDYNYAKMTEQAKKHKDFKLVDMKELSSELLRFLKEVASSDGKISKCEEDELEKIRYSLNQ